MSTLAAQENTELAGRWHFASVLFLLLAVGAATLVRLSIDHHAPFTFQASQRLPAYLRMAVLEWLLFAYLVLGIRREASSVSTVIDAYASGLRRWLSSIGLGIAASAAWMVLGAIIMTALRPTADELRGVQSFLPHGVAEKLGFAALTLTAGFCEEFIYRGYLQRQFHAWTGSLTLAVVLQAGLFALLHISLPWKFVLSVTAMALFLGALVGWRRTLVPAMLVHTIVNLVGGLLSSAGSTA